MFGEDKSFENLVNECNRINEKYTEAQLRKQIPKYDYDSDDEQLKHIFNTADELFPQTDQDGKDYLQNVMDEIESILSRHERDYELDALENESKIEEEKQFGVVLTGGSIGDKEREPKWFDTEEEAKAYKKRMNKQLSAGEKGYYKLRYKMARKVKEGEAENLWDKIVHKIHGTDSKWESVVDLIAQVWNGGFDQWIDNGYADREGALAIDMLLKLDTDASKSMAELTEMAINSEYMNLRTAQHDDAVSEEDWEEAAAEIDPLATKFYDELDDQLVKDLASQLGLIESGVEEHIKYKGIGRMFGDNTLYESMINDFEAIERDPNKNEEVDEKKDEPKELKPKHSGEKMKKLEEDEEAEPAESKGDEAKEETLHPAAEAKEEVDEALAEEYVVTAQAFDRGTGEPKGDSRDEVINIKTNKIFADAKTILDIKKAYEAFWNDLNPSSREVVFVSSVRANTAEPDESEEEAPPVESKVKESLEDLDAATLTALKDAWELIGTYDSDPHVRSMSDEKVEEIMEFIGEPEMDMVRREDELPRGENMEED